MAIDLEPQRSRACTTFTIRSGPRQTPSVSVDVTGALDRDAAPGFGLLLREFVGDQRVVIDLTACRRVDDAGLHALVGAARRIEQAGGEVDVVGASLATQAGIVAAGAASILAAHPRTSAPVARPA